jgi:hypothetical protein
VGGSGGGGIGTSSRGLSEYKASGLGEAQEKACKALVRALIAKKDRLE